MGLIKTKRSLIIGLGAFLALSLMVGGAWWHGNNHGKTSQRNQYYEELEQLRGELAEQKKKSGEIVAQRDTIIRQERKKANAKITKLLRENQKFRDWWDQPVPDDAVDLAFGVRRDADP